MKRGVTLLEVLFAIMVASIGLLALLATYTLANANLRKARIADVTSVAGESAAEAFRVEGMNERAKWLYWDANAGNFAPVPPTFNQAGQPLYGRAFCIDPAFVAHNHDEDVGGGTNNSGLWSWFPAVPEQPTNAIPHASRMVRLTLDNGGPGSLRMSYFQADKVFRIEDELLYERPPDNTQPARQLYTAIDTGSGPEPSRRQEEGRTTWFATLCPKLDRFNGITGDEYILSIIVCRERTGESLHVTGSGGPEQHPWNEWTAKILAGDFHANGFGGGEVTITTNDPAQDPTFNGKDYLDLRSGSWILLGRTVGGIAGPIQRFQWYRVADAGETAPNGQRWSQDVTLMGPDWLTDPTGTPQECDVVIMPSVAHVYERTVKVAF